MHENKICFAEIDSEESFANLATTIGAKAVNGIIRMPAGVGAGTLRKIKFEDGFLMRAWDLTPEKPMRFKKSPIPNQRADKTFHLVYLLKPRSFQSDSFNLGADFPLHEGMNTVLISNQTTVEFEVAAGFQFKAIELSFTSAWLQESFKEACEHTHSFIAQLDENEQPTRVMDTCTFTEFKTLTSLHERAVYGQNGILELKAGSLFLISEFFNRLFNHQPHEVIGSRIFHYHRMLEVEKILKDHLQKKLPSIDSIAHQVALSVSTLKRHFKLMYSKSIYEYYLDLKMDLARRLLQEKPLTINEVAAMLDYEKVSSFIDMFKKHFGYSPGNIRKNGILR